MEKKNLLEYPRYTFAPNYNSFIWFLPKTSSTLLCWVFAHFDFKPYAVNPETNVFEFNPPTILHLGHDFYYPPDYENMNFICTIRNPYRRIFSYFKMQKYSYRDVRLKKPEPKIEDFENFFYNNFLEDEVQLKRILPRFDKKLPNFVIRTENIFEDLLKIDFIKNSKLNESGILSEMCNREMNTTPPLDIENYLSPQTKEKIYETFKIEFEIGGYQK